MDFTLTEEQVAAASVASDIFGRVSASRVDAPAPPTGNDWFDKDTWKALADNNLIGLAIAEDVGGNDLGILEITSTLIEQGKHLGRVPLAVTAAVGGPAIDAFAGAERRKAILPGVVEGRTIVSVALVEPNSYDPATVTTTAAQTDGGWRLDGEKVCVPFGQFADLILVPASTGQSSTEVFIVDPKAAGVTITELATTNGQPEASVKLDGVVVGADDQLHGDDVLGWLVDRATLASCAVQLGVAEQALQMTAAYTSTREQFGKPIAMFQSVQMAAADALLSVECIRSTLWQAAWLISVDRPVGNAVSVAKFYASDGGQKVTATAQQLHGGMGVDLDYPLHRYTLWSKYNELSLGSGHAHLARIGAALAAR
ncbi:acyl-CoA dehydrogenase family protein [Microbispora sp. H11081]|uniref:acyl-CoA dehydrogenase family protein n=1 Tax=Microbispora sp. H11081 TaxID=2729107 RepID=UPI0014750996|nr:acyl-CoA dehydrogenase family protein [Microbispora sp. H11081]